MRKVKKMEYTNTRFLNMMKKSIKFKKQVNLSKISHHLLFKIK